MQGKLELESDVGKGCHALLSVPAPEVERRQPQDDALLPPTADQQTRRPAVILICDDDQDMRAIHEYYLGRAGYEVLIASDGQTAVDKAMAERPDLVLLDINTPGLSGVEAAEALRRQGFAAPIVALTASDASKLNPELFAERLRKPLRMPELLETLNALLQDSTYEA